MAATNCSEAINNAIHEMLGHAVFYPLRHHIEDLLDQAWCEGRAEGYGDGRQSMRREMKHPPGSEGHD